MLYYWKLQLMIEKYWPYLIEELVHKTNLEQALPWNGLKQSHGMISYRVHLACFQPSTSVKTTILFLLSESTLNVDCGRLQEKDSLFPSQITSSHLLGDNDTSSRQGEVIWSSDILALIFHFHFKLNWCKIGRLYACHKYKEDGTQHFCLSTLWPIG